jgi:prepilin-type N-terminal cleavage/methylation domain-containing protein
MHTRSGFTLIELSIVLVIIGLIAGGVLVGRDLIEAARIRQQITEIEQFKTAVNTFRIKYNGLPGDLNYTDAAALGFTQRSGQPGHGDGDGILEYCDGTVSAAPNLGCENVLFWRDLSDASLIEGSFTTATDTPVTVAAGQSNNLYVPDAKVGAQTSVVVFSIPSPLWVQAGVSTPEVALGGTISCGVGSVCYALINLYGVNAGAYVPGPYSGKSTGLTPLEAFAIDSKIDDGLPTSGNVYGGQISSQGVIWPEDPQPPQIQITAGFSPTNCLTLSVSPTDPDMVQDLYATTSAIDPLSGQNSAPNTPSCMMNISGQ